MVFDIGYVVLCIHGKQDNGWHENLLLKSPITRWETSRRDSGQTAARGRTVVSPTFFCISNKIRCYDWSGEITRKSHIPRKGYSAE